jgi:hypothetical protein
MHDTLHDLPPALWRSLVLGLTALALAGCPSNQVDHSGMGRVHDPVIGASLVPPTGWQPLAPTLASRLRFAQPPHGTTNVNVVLSKDNGETFEKIVEGIKAQAPASLPNWTFVKQRPVQIQGRPGQVIESIFGTPDDKRYLIQYQVRSDGGRFFTISFTTTQDEYPSTARVFEDCAGSFRCD